MAVRPLRAALPSGAYKAPELRVDHLVIGAGVVGLAIANALARRWPEKSTYVVERHAQHCQETSSRNSEVIHAGIYYPPDSLKTRLCLRGRDLLYERAHVANERGVSPISVKRVGKLVVGDSPAAAAYLERLHAHSKSLGALAPHTQLLSGAEARELEPDLSPNTTAALLSPNTGIVSAHDLMANLESELYSLPNGETPDAQVVYGTSVVRIDPHEPRTSLKRGADKSQEGWVVQTQTGGDTDALLARVVINSSGLNGPRLLNSLLRQMGEPRDAWIPMYFLKGSYAGYRGPGAHASHLIYPTPNFGGGGAMHSLGTHLTLDIDGNVRFGPDAEWLSPPDGAEDAIDAHTGVHTDFWAKELAPEGSDAWLDNMHRAIRAYLPGVRREGLAPAYSGIRPKLCGPDATTASDFNILFHSNRNLGQQPVWQKELPDANGALINLLGIESPGLTSSLAIAELVADALAERIWGKISARAQRVVEEPGDLGAWA
ncbi:hypothetical protein MCUN1_001971 [Malassezia cuniculi]|uniref:L-2-hydroxyglutarate dehydrogenase, mitochondrial n=1 Tax=Malassezia cuniculi TaxID=948313 RepID=A0AAF0EYP2_9BASI|nr:hypothetical protein MCUN1_001971 [Malassezia cuniculi]